MIIRIISLLALFSNAFSFRNTALLPSHSSSVVNRITVTQSGRLRIPSSLHAAADVVNSNNYINNATPQSSSISVSEWHKIRRREMLSKYGDKIGILERDVSSQNIGIPLLLLTCTALWSFAIISGNLPIWGVILLSIFPGSMFSLWQLQILHDVIHGSFFEKGKTNIWGISRKTLQNNVLFWGSLPSIFGYYLYLKVGHITHHNNTGEYSLADVFDSPKDDFEDGDVLFVAHRMNMKGDYGPTFNLPFGKQFKMSISRSGFHFWKKNEAVLNALRFSTSFLFERVMLAINDVFVAILGKNFFFLNKPQSFHNDCATYARVATMIRFTLLYFVGWKSLLFLYLSESLWSLPPHPACAMFISNHGSVPSDDSGNCIPTSSTYTGPWYSVFTLGTNYHCEHHDFPTIPFHKLHELRKIAPEYYRSGSNDDLYAIMRRNFGTPDFYACMDANQIAGSKLD